MEREKERCTGWDCGHWELTKTEDGGFALEHRDMQIWLDIWKTSFYAERYLRFGMPVPEEEGIIMREAPALPKGRGK